MTEKQASTGQYEDMQSAPRFPLHLTASVKTQGSAYSAETENISANGVLFAMDNDVAGGIDGGLHDPAAGRSRGCAARTCKSTAGAEWCAASKIEAGAP